MDMDRWIGENIGWGWVAFFVVWALLHPVFKWILELALTSDYKSEEIDAEVHREN